jgi:hypothetical protein
MGITVQFRGFGSYPRPQLAVLPEAHPRAGRSRNWKTVHQSGELVRQKAKPRPRSPGLRCAACSLPSSCFGKYCFFLHRSKDRSQQKYKTKLQPTIFVNLAWAVLRRGS